MRLYWKMLQPLRNSVTDADLPLPTWLRAMWVMRCGYIGSGPEHLSFVAQESAAELRDASTAEEKADRQHSQQQLEGARHEVACLQESLQQLRVSGRPPPTRSLSNEMSARTSSTLQKVLTTKEINSKPSNEHCKSSSNQRW